RRPPPAGQDCRNTASPGHTVPARWPTSVASDRAGRLASARLRPTQAGRCCETAGIRSRQSTRLQSKRDGARRSAQVYQDPAVLDTRVEYLLLHPRVELMLTAAHVELPAMPGTR